MTLKLISTIKKNLSSLLAETSKIEYNEILEDIENDYVKIINLSRVIFFYIIQMLFDRSKD